MGKKLLLGMLLINLSFFILGCNIGGERYVTDISGEKKHKCEEEYIEKISSAIINMRADGSIKNMREISETGNLDDDMINQLEVSNGFFKCLIEDLKDVNVPYEFSSYNNDIVNYLNEAKTSLEIMKSSDDGEVIKTNAKSFIDSNREVSNLVDKVLVSYAGR